MKRPSRTFKRRPNSAKELAKLASKASYVGSSEHKAKRWWGGLPSAYVGKDEKATRPKKQHTTICHLVKASDRTRASEWVRNAIIAGQYKFVEADQDFPKHIWYKDDKGQNWFGMCVNTAAGTYKGWPIAEEERREIFD